MQTPYQHFLDSLSILMQMLQDGRLGLDMLDALLNNPLRAYGSTAMLSLGVIPIDFSIPITLSAGEYTNDPEHPVNLELFQMEVDADTPRGLEHFEMHLVRLDRYGEPTVQLPRGSRPGSIWHLLMLNFTRPELVRHLNMVALAKMVGNELPMLHRRGRETYLSHVTMARFDTKTLVYGIWVVPVSAP